MVWLLQRYNWAYSDDMDLHNYDTLRHSGQINLAVYDAKLIFHFELPNWNVVHMQVWLAPNLIDARVSEQFFNGTSAHNRLSVP